MAAPHVAGGLALVMEAFPALSAQQAAARLLATAHYQGLVTIDGCTIGSCPAQRLREVFGRGKMDLKAALQPVGSLQLGAGGQFHPASATGWQLPPVLNRPVRQALAGRQLVAEDGFDRARFVMQADDFLQPSASSAPAARDPDLSRLFGLDTQSRQASFRLADSGPNGHSLYLASGGPMLATGRGQPDRGQDIQPRPAALTDLMPDGPLFWTGADQMLASGRQLRSALGFDAHRQSAILAVSHARGRRLTWFGQGLARSQASWLGSQGRAALATGDSTDFWGFAGISQQHGQLDWSVAGLAGTSRMAGPSGSLVRKAEARLAGWQLAAGWQSAGAGYWQAGLVQAPRLLAGRIEMDGLAGPAGPAGRQQLVLDSDQPSPQSRLNWHYKITAAARLDWQASWHHRSPVRQGRHSWHTGLRLRMAL